MQARPAGTVPWHSVRDHLIDTKYWGEEKGKGTPSTLSAVALSQRAVLSGAFCHRKLSREER